VPAVFPEIHHQGDGFGVHSGILIALVGCDSSTDAFRFTFGSFKLLQGFDVVPIVVGLFGITEVLRGIKSNAATVVGKKAAISAPGRRNGK
jgi:putative tricarboxylic transport membrane protein